MNKGRLSILNALHIFGNQSVVLCTNCLARPKCLVYNKIYPSFKFRNRDMCLS